MRLADERLQELDNPSLTANERTLMRCDIAADLIHKGQYEAAREALGELWPGVGESPKVKKMPPVTAAEVLLQCGVLTGWLGSVRNVSGAQEKAKDLLSKSIRKFQSQGQHKKVPEAQYELGICYGVRRTRRGPRRVDRGVAAPQEADAEMQAKILIRPRLSKSARTGITRL